MPQEKSSDFLIESVSIEGNQPRRGERAGDLHMDEIISTVDAQVADAIRREEGGVALERGISKTRLPRSGPASFLVIDESRGDIAALPGVLRLLAPDLHSHVMKLGSYTVIVTTAESSAGILANLAESLRGTESFHSTILLGHGVISHGDLEHFRIDTFPSQETLFGLSRFKPGIYVMKNAERLLRRGKHASIGAAKMQPLQDEGLPFVELESFIAKSNFVTGGPDAFIAAGSELVCLKAAIADERVELVIVFGEPRFGKSRLCAEAFRTFSVAPVYTLLKQPSKNRIGHGLLDIATDLDAVIGEAGIKSDPLRRFARKSFTAREICVGGPDGRQDLVKMCMQGLKALQRAGRGFWVIDDYHFVDGGSDQSIVSMVQLYIANGGKVVVLARPAEVSHSLALRNWRERGAKELAAGRNSVVEVTVNGLDFTDRRIANLFAFHCLPLEVRGSKSLESGFSLGNWPSEIGRQAGRSPGFFTDRMDEITEEAPSTSGRRPGTLAERRYPNLRVDQGTVVLAPQMVSRLSEMLKPGSDFATTEIEAIATTLDEQSRTLLQYLALMGGEASKPQIARIIRELMHVSFETDPKKEVDRILAPILRRYLTRENKIVDRRAVAVYRFKHEAKMDYVLDSMSSVTPRERRQMCVVLYYKFPGLPLDRKFNLAQNVASLDVDVGGRPYELSSFWADYIDTARAHLAACKVQRDPVLLHREATSILKKPVIGKLLSELESPTADSAQIDDLSCFAVEVLFHVAGSALHLSRFEEVETIVRRIEAIHANYSSVVPNIQDAKLLKAEADYIRVKDPRDKNGVQAMEASCRVAIDSGLLSPGQVVVLRVKEAYKGSSGAEREARIRAALAGAPPELTRAGAPDRGSPLLPSWLQVHRLVNCAMPSMGFLERLRNQGGEDSLYDDDVMFHPKALPYPNRDAAIANELIMRFNEVLDQRAVLNDFYAELTTIEFIALLHALRGRYPEVVRLASELYRQATNMNMHLVAARAAKLKGDTKILQALTGREGNDTTLLRDKTSYYDLNLDQTQLTYVFDALRTRRKEGKPACALLEAKDPYRFVTAVQVIRDTGILWMVKRHEFMRARERGDSVRLQQMHDELSPYILEAMRDIWYLNHEWRESAGDGEAQYYLGFIGHVLEAFHELRLSVPEGVSAAFRNPQAYPYLTEEALLAGINYSKRILPARSHLLGCEFNSKRMGLLKTVFYLFGGDRSKIELFLEKAK